MKKAKCILQALGTLLFAWLMLLDNSASAAVTCTTSPGVRSGMTCLNSGENGTVLTIRHVPAWGPNAGYVLVDMCPGEEIQATTGTVVQHTVGTTGQHRVVTVAQIPPETPVSKEPPPECARRFCTDDISEFALRIAATPIPIGFDFFLGAAVAFRHSEFEITCNTLHQPGGTSP